MEIKWSLISRVSLPVCLIIIFSLVLSPLRGENTAISITLNEAGTIVFPQMPQGLLLDDNGLPLQCTGATKTQLTFNGTVNAIGSYAFHNFVGLHSLILPESVTEVGYFAFSNCTSLIRPIYNKTVFARMPISHIDPFEVPDGTKTIASGAFRNCEKLTRIKLPNSLKEIQSSAFSKCSALESITIPENVTVIEDNAFFGCEQLHEIHFESTTPAHFSAKAFSGIQNCIFFVPRESIEAYQTALEQLECSNIATIKSEETGSVIVEYYGNYESTGMFNALNSSIDHIDTEAPLILNLTHISTLPGEAEIHTKTPNTILRANSDQNIANEKNVCVDNICKLLVISDEYPFANDQPFSAETVNYERSMKNKWGTICLPFTLTSDEHVRYYTTGSISDEILSLNSVASVPAGTPAIFQRLDGSQLSLKANNAEIAVSEVSLDGDASDIQLHGTYIKLEIETEGEYYIASDKFWRKTEGTPLTINPFRAWFDLAPAKASSRTFNIEETENSEESLEAINALLGDNANIFDINGHKIQGLLPGMNLIQLSDGSYKKVMLK